jgi:hypothetical protein
MRGITDVISKILSSQEKEQGAGRPVVKNNFHNRQAQGHRENNLFTMRLESFFYFPIT